MISTINEALVALSRWVELSILGKATIMLVIGLTVVKLAGRARASVRHLLLMSTFATVSALPLVVLAAPEVLIGVPVPRAAETITHSAPPTPPAAAIEPTTSRSPVSQVSQSTSSFVPSWIAMARVVWFAGAVLLLLQLGVDLWRLYRIRRHALPWPERRQLMWSLADECGVRRSVEILLHESMVSPLMCGVWRPAVLLPVEAREWSEADLRRALVHEFEHVRRGDWVTQLAARAICALYWFHPLVWVAFRWLSLEAERTCDDAVVRCAERADYAEQLVLLAGRLSKSQAQPALGMANRSDLSRRVAALLDGSQQRGRAGLLIAASALSVAGIFVLAIAPVRAVTLTQKATGQSDQQTLLRAMKTEARIATAIDRALLEAAEEGDVEGIDDLVRRGGNVNAAIDGDGSPLIVAAREGHLDAVRFLLDRGADPNLAVPGDGNALIMAAGEAHLDVVSVLLDRGANIDQIVPGDENALIRASGRGHLDVVKLLVARGADVNARAPVDAELHLKIDEQGSLKDMKSGKELGESELRDRRALKTKLGFALVWSEAEKTEGHWRTPLSQARSGGHDEIVAFLLASGARE